MSDDDKTELRGVLDAFKRGEITEQERDDAVEAIAARGRTIRRRVEDIVHEQAEAS